MIERLVARLAGRIRPDAATALLAAFDDPASDRQTIEQAIAHAEAVANRQPDFMLAYTLGVAWETLASAHLPWEERGPAFARALAHFESAVAVAASLSSTEVKSLAPRLPAEAASFPLARRPLLLAKWRAGVLMGAEFRVRDPAKAAAYLEEVAEHAEGYHPVFYYLGEVYMLERRFDDAERIWRRGLARRPDDETIARVLARLPQDRANHARKQDDWAGVVAALTTPEGRALRSVEMLRLLGDAYFALGQLDDAEAAWRDALTISAKAGGIRGRLNKLARRRMAVRQQSG